MSESKVRTIHTSLFTDKAEKVCSSVLGQLSDGWGENDSRNDRYWKFANVKRAADGEVVIIVKTESGNNTGLGYRWVQNGFKDMSDTEVLKFFAKMIKKTAQMELRDNGISNGWKRTNDRFISKYLGYSDEKSGPVIPIAVAYCVYDILSGRDVLTKYLMSTLDMVIGHKRPEVETQARSQLEKTYIENRNRLVAEENEAIEAIQKKYQAARSEEFNKYQNALNELKHNA